MNASHIQPVMLTRRQLLAALASGAGFSVLTTACGGAASTSQPGVESSLQQTVTAQQTAIAQLQERQVSQLPTPALPRQGAAQLTNEPTATALPVTPTSVPQPSPSPMRTPLPTSVVTPDPIPTTAPRTGSGETLFEANWSAGLQTWAPYGKGSWQSTSSALLFDGNGASTLLAPHRLNDGVNYAVEASIQSLRHESYNGHSGFGLIIRVESSISLYPDLTKKHGILNGIHRNENRGERLAMIWTGGVYPEPLDAWSFDPGEDSHRYRVEVRENVIALSVDGQAILQTTSNQFLAGRKVGVFSIFDEITVRDFRVLAL